MRSRINLQGVFDGVMDAKVHRKMCIDAQFFVQRCTFLSAKGGKGTESWTVNSEQWTGRRQVPGLRIKDKGERNKDQGVRGKDKGERAPVKSATLVFFEAPVKQKPQIGWTG